MMPIFSFVVMLSAAIAVIIILTRAFPRASRVSVVEAERDTGLADAVAPAPEWLGRMPPEVVIVDVETTGLHSDDRIVTLAAIKLETSDLLLGSVKLNYLHLIFDPGKKCHPEAEKVHGYDDWTLRHQPFFAEFAQLVGNFLKSADLIVAHNVAFDMGFLNRELAAAGLAMLKTPIFCTMEKYRNVIGRPANLTAAAGWVGMARSAEAHGSLEDAWLALNVFLALKGCPRRYPFSLVEQRQLRNLQPVPPMPEGDLPPRKRRPRRQPVARLDTWTERQPIKHLQLRRGKSRRYSRPMIARRPLIRP